MKKLLIVILACLVGWKLYQKYYVADFAFNASGASQGILFTSASCGAPCADAKKTLANTSANIEEVVLSQNDKESMARLKAVGGGNSVPVLVTRSGERVDGFNEVQYFSAIADEAGVNAVPNAIGQILASHFSAKKPILVMYATAWCPYCAKARKFMEGQGIAYEERDVEKNSDYKAMYQLLDSSGYPLIYYGAKRMQGFNERTLQAMLDR